MPMVGRTYGPGYRFGFNGKEQDNEVEGQGDILNYGMRISDARLGRFLSVDPLVKSFAWWTPYQFAGNEPIRAKDLDGREIEFDFGLGIEALKPALRLPEVELPLPPGSIILPPPTTSLPNDYTVGQPQLPSENKVEGGVNDIDWNHPPANPEALGEKWEETTSPKNKTGNHREFTHKDTKQKVRWDTNDPNGAPDHWHRINPNGKSGIDKYLDKDGKPIGSEEKGAHQFPEDNAATPIPDNEQKSHESTPGKPNTYINKPQIQTTPMDNTKVAPPIEKKSEPQKPCTDCI